MASFCQMGMRVCPIPSMTRIGEDDVPIRFGTHDDDVRLDEQVLVANCILSWARHVDEVAVVELICASDHNGGTLHVLLGACHCDAPSLTNSLYLMTSPTSL